MAIGDVRIVAIAEEADGASEVRWTLEAIDCRRLALEIPTD